MSRGRGRRLASALVGLQCWRSYASASGDGLQRRMEVVQAALVLGVGGSSQAPVLLEHAELEFLQYRMIGGEERRP